MKMKLETNLPLIFLTLLVISIVVLGYLELKKMNERIKILEYLTKDKKGTQKKELPKKVGDVIDSGENIVTDKKPPNMVSQENNNRVQEWQMNNEKENIINTINSKEEYIEEIQDGNDVLVSEGGFPHPSMMYKVMGVDMDIRDEIINKINNDEPINFENDIHEEEILIDGMGGEVNKGFIEEHHSESEKDIEENIETESNSSEDKEDNEDNEDDGDDESEGESIEELNLKEISEEEEFSKDKIIVDESFSVNQLKSICKNLGLQLSGNKTTLIKRIMDNQ